MNKLSWNFRMLRILLLAGCFLEVVLVIFSVYLHGINFSYEEFIHLSLARKEFFMNVSLTAVFIGTIIFFILHLWRIQKTVDIRPLRILSFCIMGLFLTFLIFFACIHSEVRFYRKVCRYGCQNNLKVLYKACLQYADENHGMFPSDLSILVERDSEMKDIFRCPASFRHEGVSDYVYYGAGLHKDSLPDHFLLFEDKTSSHYARRVQLTLSHKEDKGFIIHLCDDKK